MAKDQILGNALLGSAVPCHFSLGPVLAVRRDGGGTVVGSPGTSGEMLWALSAGDSFPGALVPTIPFSCTGNRAGALREKWNQWSMYPEDN